ncbi:NepR family anti-sigma factor [Nitratireductor soli]|uniref:NepR family anti-sigma factor n=1 Tax=Nitratireductor soli TaxID=1670619 RepID=UPI00065E776B|nr:NepR family anti-sigma factor [Nitratireductor soli]
MSYEKPTSRRVAGRRGSGTDPLGANSEIGRKLRQYYDDLVKEEIPDRFSDLLSQLEMQEQAESAEKED